MANQHSRKTFVNLAVQDLKRVEWIFIDKLGFEHSILKFTDEKAACMIISDEA